MARNHSASRLYMDLIRSSSFIYPVWNPHSTIIEVGDYGDVDPQSGSFEYHGSVYNKEDPILAGLVKDNDPVEEVESSETITFTSGNAKRRQDRIMFLQVNNQVIPHVSQSIYTFKGNTGALLAIYKPRVKAFPHNFDIESLTGAEPCKGKYLVTKVTKCHSFCMYLAAATDATISVALQAEAPGSSAQVGASPSVKWKCEYDGGFFRSGVSEGGKEFTVFYELTRCEPVDRKWWAAFSKNPLSFR